MATLLLTLPRTGMQAGTAVDYVLSPDGVRVASASSVSICDTETVVRVAAAAAMMAIAPTAATMT